MPNDKHASHSYPRTCLFALLFFFCSAPAWAAFVTSLSATHVQSVLQMHFPVREYTTAARVSLHDPQVLLVNGASSMTLMIPVEANIPGEELRHGHALVTVGLSYKAATGELFLHDPRLQQFEMPRIADDLKREMADTVTVMAEKALPLVRIYTVREQDLNHSLDKSALKSSGIENDKLRLEFGFR